MDLTEQQFAVLCRQFRSMSKLTIGAIHIRCDEILDDINLYDMHADTVSRIGNAGWRHMFNVLGTSAIAFIYQTAEKLPGALGRYFGRLAKNKAAKLDYLEANYAAEIQVLDGVHPMRVADKMPDGMKTPDALAFAEQQNLQHLASVIRYGLDA